MNNLNLYLVWLLFVSVLISCGKEEEDTNPGSLAELDYLPTTAGSTWTYGGFSPYTLTATGVTKDINGKTYHEMEMKQGSTVNKAYVLEEKGVYTAIGMVPGLGNLELFILKEETPVGKPWEQTATMNGVNFKLTFTIVEKGISKAVESKTYKDVIHVKMTTSYTFMGQEIGADISADYYFAKGVGLIFADSGTNGQSPLLSYDVK